MPNENNVEMENTFILFSDPKNYIRSDKPFCFSSNIFTHLNILFITRMRVTEPQDYVQHIGTSSFSGIKSNTF